jgi:hypothetical protein
MAHVVGMKGRVEAGFPVYGLWARCEPNFHHIERINWLPGRSI